jgi:tetratricopeptide (TPR) repeat protein
LFLFLEIRANFYLLTVPLCEYYKYEGSAELQKYIIDKATPLKLFTILAALYNIMYLEYLEISDYNNAIKCAEQAYTYLFQSSKTLSEETYKLLSYDILFNLGLAWKYLDIKKSLQYSAQAEGVKPNDQETIIEQLKHYIILVDIDNASKQIEKIKDSDLKDLYQIMLNIVTTPNFSILTSLKDHAQKVIDPELGNLSDIMFKFKSQTDYSLSELLGTFFQNKTLKDQVFYLEVYREIWVKYFLGLLKEEIGMV